MLDHMLAYDYTVLAVAVASRARFMHYAELQQLVRLTLRVRLLRPPEEPHCRPSACNT